MKKFFTLIAAVAIAASMNAQTQEWNFSDWDLTTYGSISTDVSKDGLTIYANADKAVALDTNSKTVDGVKYTQRLKFGGTGSVSDLNNMARVVAFNVTGACDIYVVAAHGSSSGDPRPLKIDAVVNETATPVGEVTFAASEYKSSTLKYTGGAAKILIYSGKSGINLYDIKVTSGTSGISNINASEAANEGATFNLLGQKVASNAKGLVIKNGKKFINK